MTEQDRPDPVIVDAVTTVRDRFGAGGLRELLDLARHELATAEAALRDLGEATEDRAE